MDKTKATPKTFIDAKISAMEKGSDGVMASIDEMLSEKLAQIHRVIDSINSSSANAMHTELADKEQAHKDQTEHEAQEHADSEKH